MIAVTSLRRTVIPLRNYDNPLRLRELLHRVVVAEDDDTGCVNRLYAKVLPLVQSIEPRVKPNVSIPRAGGEVVPGSRILTSMVIENEVLARLVNELNRPALIDGKYA